ncbi:MAG: AAA family ATPase [Dermatophilaceae bacterium]
MTAHPPTDPTPQIAPEPPHASSLADASGSPFPADPTASEAVPDVSGTHSVEAARSALLAVRAEVAKAVVGQDAAVAGLLVALLCRGHILLEGVPGVAKTLLVRALAAALDVTTTRVQFTPDLMPGDLTGSLVFDSRTSDFRFREGPVFTNLLLADEINRTPPKTQSALLEAMEERQVSIDGRPRALPTPFLVAATQNPVEYEGTYPLPEAQLDRFVLKVVLPTPERGDEVQVLRRHASGFDPRDLAAAGIRPVASTADLDAGAAAVRQVSVSDEVAGYIVDIARATRVSPSLSLGVSPRGSTALLATSRAWAWLAGRSYVTPDDVKALAHATLGHRLSLRPEAELEGVGVAAVLDSALGSVPVPR